MLRRVDRAVGVRDAVVAVQRVAAVGVDDDVVVGVGAGLQLDLPRQARRLIGLDREAHELGRDVVGLRAARDRVRVVPHPSALCLGRQDDAGRDAHALGGADDRVGRVDARCAARVDAWVQRSARDRDASAVVDGELEVRAEHGAIAVALLEAHVHDVVVRRDVGVAQHEAADVCGLQLEQVRVVAQEGARDGDAIASAGGGQRAAVADDDEGDAEARVDLDAGLQPLLRGALGAAALKLRGDAITRVEVAVGTGRRCDGGACSGARKTHGERRRRGAEHRGAR